ncbi:MAG: selenoneine biosynthesis selenosugar synthase SenB [Hylemonella sp.]|uniref:selenoneine biosynthesis selenosugar synthase SenB n=1 Tax=Hylemonella sp. TaxID=2066020 RepID=UPI00391C7D74
MTRPLVLIVSPALAGANNGNWQTAWRWSRLLAPHYRTQIIPSWQAGEQPQAAALLALHARRSAETIAAWAQAHPHRGLAVVLTGTDLYRDIHHDAAAQRSLALAQRLVVLQELGPQALPAAYRAKTRVIFQSTTTRRTLDKTGARLRAVMVGHLREEKGPQTLWAAARLLRDHPDIRIDHIGEALDPSLATAARSTMADCPAYRWLGGLPHEAVRRHIQRAHLLVHCSRMEGGAHVLMEAVCSGTPVLATRIEGNVGMLGADYGGYFPVDDAAALAGLLQRCRDAPDRVLALRAQCGLRAPLFAPAAEQAALLALLQDLT